MAIDQDIAVRVLRDAAVIAPASSSFADWQAKVERLFQLCERGGTRTHMAMLVTAMLARACSDKVDLFAFKPSAAKGNPNAYSARILCETVVVPLSAELGFSIGVTGRQPLNNQPYFRMKSLDDGTPISGAGKPAFEYMVGLIRELGTHPMPEAKGALAAFVSIMRGKVTKYAEVVENAQIQVEHLVAAIESFVAQKSEGGKRAQAVVAGLLDVVAGPERVTSGRINDPSRRYPGDVLLMGIDHCAMKAFEVRDKPVSVADVQLFARKCASEGIRDAVVVMVSPHQPILDNSKLDAWAAEVGVHITLFTGWCEFTRQAMFWGAAPIAHATASAITRVHKRLIEVEASVNAVENWVERTSERRNI